MWYYFLLLLLTTLSLCIIYSLLRDNVQKFILEKESVYIRVNLQGEHYDVVDNNEQHWWRAKDKYG